MNQNSALYPSSPPLLRRSDCHCSPQSSINGLRGRPTGQIVSKGHPNAVATPDSRSPSSPSWRRTAADTALEVTPRSSGSRHTAMAHLDPAVSGQSPAPPSPPSSRGGSPAASLEDSASIDSAPVGPEAAEPAVPSRPHMSWLQRHRHHPPERREPPPASAGARASYRSSESGKSLTLSTTAEESQAMRRLVDDLSRDQSRERRLVCLKQLCAACEPGGDGEHSPSGSVTAAAPPAELLLQSGAVPALASCLAAAQPDDGELAGLACASLERVLRAVSPLSVERTYLNLVARPRGKDERESPQVSTIQHPLLAHLLQVIERCDLGTLNDAEATMRSVSRTLMCFAQCPDLRPMLLRLEGMLDMLCRSAGNSSSSSTQTHESPLFQPLTAAPSSSTSSATLLECRLLRVQLIAVLATCESNKVLLFEKEGLMERVVRYAHADSSDLVRQFAGKTMMELASAPANQASMAQSDHVLGVLAKMVFVEKGATVREAVITALQNLAYCKTVRVRLVSFKSGALLEALKHALSTDLDAKARRRAAGALMNLVCVETANQMGAHQGLLNALALVSAKDANPDVQTRASLALTKLANCITSEMECYEVLLDALVVASLSNSSNSISAVLRVKARETASREIMARHPGIVDTLCDLCSSNSASHEDKTNAVRAILHLSNEPKTQKLLCNPTVLNALLKCANFNDPDLEEARKSAIRALERLGTEPTNRGLMARREGMLTTLARAVERETACEASGQEAEHGYLAKPLLMSLLVSM